MHKPVIFMFSGQGSQYYQMGRELYEKQPHFREWLQKGDRFVQEYAGFSIIEKIYDSDKKCSVPFNRTLCTHPAIFMVEYSLGQLLLAQGIEPDYVLGASMGSFAALTLTGALSFEQGLIAVIEQARCLEKQCCPGGMIAILNNPMVFYQTGWLHRQSNLAGVNFCKHFVVSGPKKNMFEIQQAFKHTSTATQALHVSHSFHSSWIDPAQTCYNEFLQTLSYQTPCIPFICCINSEIMVNIPHTYLWTTIRETIRFQETITRLEATQPVIYVDLGPSSTLVTLVKYNLIPQSRSELFPIMTQVGKDLANLEKILNKIKNKRGNGNFNHF
ncbi:acyltransferase domain-containing protein [Anaerolineales bacterium HSG24]|nr:acyltransferase domain-containing protein [Anaerolineales bacterium HSG24]